MFPTLRLLIGALFASVIALCGGFGVFAAFRVNHEPLGRLPADTGALQLVADAPARPVLTWGVPFRPQAGDGQIGASNLNAPSPAPVRRTAIRLGNPATPPALRIDAVSRSRPGPALQAVVPPAAAAAPASKLSYMPPTAAPAPVTARTSGTSAAATSAAQTAPPAATPPQHAAAAEAKAVEPALAVRPAAVDASPQTPKTVIASTAATGPAPKAASPAISAAIPAIETQNNGKPKPPHRIVGKPTGRHRVVAKRRVIRKTAAHEPLFRSAPSFAQQPQTPTRAAKKSAKGDAPVNPYAWPDAH
jgi:hypothetical protein